MVLTVELLKRLNANEEPLPKRLKLAENVFSADEIPIIHREDLVLQWLCKICSGNQRAWGSLRNCLSSKYLHIKADVKKLLISTFIKTLQGDMKDINTDVFKCCELLVSNDGMQQYFVGKPDDLGLLIKSLLECIHKILKQNLEEISITLINKSNELILTSYNTAITVVEFIVQIFKSAFDTKDNLRTIFISDILYPLCAIIDHKCNDNTNRLGAATYKCIQQLIFGKKRAQNKEFLENKSLIQFTDLLSILSTNAKTRDLQSNLMTFTFFFCASINIFKSDSTILDLILRELVKCAGDQGKEILNSFLQHLGDITFDFDNKIDDITLLDYCQNIVDGILLNKNTSKVDYDLLIQFCYFNPLLIEKKIQDIFKKIFIKRSLLECTNLLISIMDVCLHTRQEQKVVSSLLIALRDSSNQMSSSKVATFFAREFREKFMKLLNNITNSQSIDILRILIYHLKTDCMEVLQSKDTSKEKNIIILQATIELLTIFLDSICIYERIGTEAFHKKFINNINELRNILSLLIVQILHVSYDENVTVLLLAAIFSWNETHKALKYYMPKIVPEDLKSPILEDQWKQLIQRITNFGTDNSKNSMNKLILQQVKISQNALSESLVVLNDLIGGIEYSWQRILKFDVQVIPFLSNEQISKVTYLLLEQIMYNVDSFDEWIKILHKDSLLENKRLLIAILNWVLIQMGHLITEGVTKSLSKHFHTEFLLEIETMENERTNNILLSMKEEFLKNEWIHMEDIPLSRIKMYLEVLLHLPLMFLSSKIRTVIFIFIFALKVECDHENEIISLCDTIFSDLLEKSDINIFEYINSSILLNELPHNKNTRRSVELFLRNYSSHEILKEIIKSSTKSKKNILLLLRSMEHVKTKLNVDQKKMIKKAEIKISKVVMKTMPPKVENSDDVKILNLILKVSITNGNVDEQLKNIAQSILDDIFTNIHCNKVTNEMLEDGLQLAALSLHNKKMFQITNQTLRGIWFASFKNPCIDVILPLLESSETKEFNEFLEQLNNEVVKAVSSIEENNIENIFVMWNAVLKTNMSSNRSKLRLSAINKLLQIMQSITIPERFWPSLLKIIQNLLSAKHLYFPDYIIDMCICLGFKSLQGTTIIVCSDTLTLCNVLLKMRTSSVLDRLPALLLLYRHILNIVVHKSKVIVNKSEEYIFKCLALDIEKFTSFLVKIKKDLIRISPYLIADLLELFSEASIADFVRASLRNSINHLISICDQHGIALLSRTLPVSMQEIFKVQLDIYNKFYKFAGKI